jgi:hypothetical protein
MIIMFDFSSAIILIPLQQNIRSISFVLEINLLFQIILIVTFLGVAWIRNRSQLGALKARRIVLGLYIAFLVFDALIYIIGIVQGSMPHILMGPIILNDPVLLLIFLSPPILIMYLDIRSPESSGLYRLLFNSGLVLLVWLVVIVIAAGFPSPPPSVPC